MLQHAKAFPITLFATNFVTFGCRKIAAPFFIRCKLQLLPPYI
jgi:hypothetical protein